MTRHFFLLVLILGWSTQLAAQEVIGVVKNASMVKDVIHIDIMIEWRVIC